MTTPRSINRLNDGQKFKFLSWFEKRVFVHTDTDTAIAELATLELGFTITTGNVIGAWEALGRKRPTAPKTAEATLEIVLKAVTELYTQLGLELPPELKELQS